MPVRKDVNDRVDESRTPEYYIASNMQA